MNNLLLNKQLTKLKIWTSYMHINKINNKKYIGITKQNPPKYRWRNNGSGYRIGQPLMYNAIQEYGWDNFDHIILHTNLTFEEAKEKEAYYIKLYNTTNREYGYNVQSYDDNMNILHSEETKNKISKIRLEHDYSGEKHSMWGKHHSEKTKQLLSKIHSDGLDAGENNGNSKLTQDKMYIIFCSIEDGIKLGKEFNITNSAVNNIKRGEAWKNDIIQCLLMQQSYSFYNDLLSNTFSIDSHYCSIPEFTHYNELELRKFKELS